jgi:EcsC protein family
MVRRMNAEDGSIERIDRPPQSLWERLRAEPERAPEYVALAAADHFAPQAESWIRGVAGHRDPHRLARTAVRRHVRLSRMEGAVLGIGGLTTAAADFGALLWIQSRMVFYVAAAYGFDPRHPMRPAELLALQGLYDTPAEARASLDGLGRPMAHAMVSTALERGGSQSVTSRAVRYGGKKVVRKVGGKAVPLIASPIAAVQNGGATKELGQRSIAYYGGDRS